MKKPDMKRIGDVAKGVGEIMLNGLAVALVIAALGSEATRSKANDRRDYSYGRYGYDYDYGDAVEAIMNSNMFSHCKSEAIDVLKRDEDANYYRAIASIVKDSDTFDNYKVEMIRKLSRR